ncbi:MAG TPA: SPFH domain-containing protein [Sedimentisphaerales bacterium]|nr:SPFH domain-containing protein [Sedimentisphaerales bacterium]
MAQGHKQGHDHDAAPGQTPERAGPSDQLDAAGKSLSDALHISFTILKVIMIVLIVAFLASGFRTVGPDERGLVLRFGKIQGIGDEAILGPGAHWVFPYPIDELIKIPVEKNINLPVNTFWYKETRDDILGGGVKPRNFRADKLDPMVEGYCLTRSQAVAAQGPAAVGQPSVREVEGGDYSIVHTKWQINYQISNVEQFFRNVHVRDVKPGEIYSDVMIDNIAPLLRSVVDDAIVTAMVHYTIDDALQSVDTIPRRVQQFVQRKLDALESGIRVVQMQLVSAKWPMQIDEAFEAYVAARQQSDQTVTQARTYAETTLNKTGGQVAHRLCEAILDPHYDPQKREELWSQVTGDAQQAIAQAQAYQTKVVEAARASASYLASILPEYRKRPRLVARERYLAAMEEILNNADEKFLLASCGTDRDREIRILLNRDNKLKPKDAR